MRSLLPLHQDPAALGTIPAQEALPLTASALQRAEVRSHLLAGNWWRTQCSRCHELCLAAPVPHASQQVIFSSQQHMVNILLTFLEARSLAHLALLAQA